MLKITKEGIILNNERLPEEDFKDYKNRRKHEKLRLKSRMNGNWLWRSKNIDEEKKHDSKMNQGTLIYEKNKSNQRGL